MHADGAPVLLVGTHKDLIPSEHQQEVASPVFIPLLDTFRHSWP